MVTLKILFTGFFIAALLRMTGEMGESPCAGDRKGRPCGDVSVGP